MGSRTMRRAVNLRLLERSDKVSASTAQKNIAAFTDPHFSVVRKFAGGVRPVQRRPGRAEQRVAPGNRLRPTDSHKHCSNSDPRASRKPTKPKSGSARSGKPKTASRPEPPMVRSWLFASARIREALSCGLRGAPSNSRGFTGNLCEYLLFA